MYTCANCSIMACASDDDTVREKLPKNCPMREKLKMQQSLEKYNEPENKEFYIKSSSIEGEGYCQWPRLRETLELCKRMEYKKIGIAFCKGLCRESRIVSDLFRTHGFEVVSIICKTGGIPKEQIGIPKESKISESAYEVMCNPIAQAEFLNSQNTEFNIAIGLCVGHDSLFYKYSDAMVTTLIAKDRVLAHNPCGAVYCIDGYFKKKMEI